MVRRRSSRWIAIRYAGLVACLCLLAAAWTGCTAQRRYKTLSFFFDGVPDPNAPAAGSGIRVSASGAPVRNFVHKPYGDGKCESCHAGGSDSVFRAEGVAAIGSNICLKCHQNIVNQYPVMHGPVSAVECLKCHTPHESNTEHLLASASPRVCVQCHVPELLTPNPPEHFDKKTDCLICHSAHGGEKHGLFRPGVKYAPTTRPSATAMVSTVREEEPR
jgi:predicted CXXCH cytochrome family protein